MRFAVDASTDQCLGPKLLGEYEFELIDVVERLCAVSWKSIVKFGCACGYYLTGLAMRCPSAMSYGFELEPRLREVARQVAADNGVDDRVQDDGLCTAQRLDELAIPDSLLRIDIEGGEDELLRPSEMPALKESTMLIELHDLAKPGVSSDWLGRFHHTHRATVTNAMRKRGPHTRQQRRRCRGRIHVGRSTSAVRPG